MHCAKTWTGALLVLVALTTATGSALPHIKNDNDAQPVSAFRELPCRGPEGEVTLVTDAECGLTSELEGTWVLHEALAEELFPALVEKRERQPNRVGPMLEFTITLEDAESEALTKLGTWTTQSEAKDADRDWLSEFKDACRRVLLVGRFQSGKTDRSIAVIQWRGNAMMIVFRENGSIDTSYLSMAFDHDGDNDYIFIREETRHAHSPYKRKAEEE